jgi:hypothetical protein
MWLRAGQVVGSGKQGDELWSFAKLYGPWLPEKQSVSEERLCFMELHIYFMYDIFKPNQLVVQSMA